MPVKRKSPSGSPDAIVAVGQLPDWTQYDALREFHLQELVTRRQTLMTEKKALESGLSELNEEIAAALTIAEAKAVRVGEWRVTRVEGRGASSIVKERLLELGVDADVIVAATKPGKEYVTVQVKPMSSRATAPDEEAA